MQEEKQIKLELKDNTHLSITIFPAELPNAPILLINPAFGIKATYYARYANQLGAAGIIAVTTDLRGHGLSSVRPSKQTDFGFLEMIEDLKAIHDVLKTAYPASKMFMLGHSYGGQVASLATAKYPNTFNGLAMIGSPNVYYKGWSGVHYYRRKMMLHLIPVFTRIFITSI